MEPINLEVFSKLGWRQCYFLPIPIHCFLYSLYHYVNTRFSFSENFFVSQKMEKTKISGFLFLSRAKFSSSFHLIIEEIARVRGISNLDPILFQRGRVRFGAAAKTFLGALRSDTLPTQKTQQFALCWRSMSPSEIGSCPRFLFWISTFFVRFLFLFYFLAGG